MGTFTRCHVERIFSSSLKPIRPEFRGLIALCRLCTCIYNAYWIPPFQAVGSDEEGLQVSEKTLFSASAWTLELYDQSVCIHMNVSMIFGIWLTVCEFSMIHNVRLNYLPASPSTCLKRFQCHFMFYAPPKQMFSLWSHRQVPSFVAVRISSCGGPHIFLWQPWKKNLTGTALIIYKELDTTS